MENLQIHIRCKCPECNGEGYYRNPFYIAANKAEGDFKKVYGRYWTNEQWERYLSKNGYNPRRPPAEELECDSCGGSGMYQKWIPIQELTELVNQISHDHASNSN